MKKKKFILSGLLCLLLLSAFCFICYQSTRPVILEFGMFTGSNWDVASANSFKIMDRAIADFEKTHPNVKIHYYSGIAKEDYSEWCSRKLLEHPMYSGCWILILTNLRLWEL